MNSKRLRVEIEVPVSLVGKISYTMLKAAHYALSLEYGDKAVSSIEAEHYPCKGCVLESDGMSVDCHTCKRIGMGLTDKFKEGE